MKQDYTTAYLRHLAGRRSSVPNPAAYRRVLPNGSTKPLTAKECRLIRSRVDALVAQVVEAR